MGPRFKVSSERLVKPGIEPTTPGLQGEWLNHCATEASVSGVRFYTFTFLTPNIAVITQGLFTVVILSVCLSLG